MNVLNRPRFQNALKALALLAMAVFLYTRLASGVLFFYINQRFMAYTVFAIVGLVMVALSYRPTSRRSESDEALHSHHQLGWVGLALVMTPIVLGLLVPPQPLGAAAMQNREIDVATRTRSALPAAVRAAAQKDARERNLLDWLHAFAASPNPAQEFAGQPVDVVGFIYHDERLGDNEVLVNRFVVSCCVADAGVVSMIVRWPDAASLPDDTWVQVKGVLQPGEFNGRAVPIVVAQEVIPTALPHQPYLYR